MNWIMHHLPWSPLLFPVLLMLVLPWQEPPEYRDGTFCTPKGDLVGPLQTPNNPCVCRRVDHDPLCEGVPWKDQRCRQWCHEQHCACPVACEPVCP